MRKLPRSNRHYSIVFEGKAQERMRLDREVTVDNVISIIMESERNWKVLRDMIREIMKAKELEARRRVKKLGVVTMQIS